jgi:hypothetical protein
MSQCRMVEVASKRKLSEDLKTFAISDMATFDMFARLCEYAVMSKK